MLAPLDAERLAAALTRFRTVFEELEARYLERSDLIAQIALALLCRERVLLVGPPGTAKRSLARAVVGRVVDDVMGHSVGFPSRPVLPTHALGPTGVEVVTFRGREGRLSGDEMDASLRSLLTRLLGGPDALLRGSPDDPDPRRRARIETAILTSDRYLPEIRDAGREPYAALVDEIAFLGFVPRAFAEASSLLSVLHWHVGVDHRPTLASRLSVADLAVLRGAVEAVHVSGAMLERFATMLELYEEELAAATRDDPAFTPTRHPSPRLAVRLARVLRAVVIYDRAMRRRDRPLAVQPKDMRALRLAMVVSGPSPDVVTSLLAREVEPRERRQLLASQRELEVYERVLDRLPLEQDATEPAAPADVDLDAISETMNEAWARHGTAPIAEVARELASSTDLGHRGAEELAALLHETVTELADRAVQAGLTASLGGAGGAPVAAVEELATIADDLDEIGGQGRPIARWLRGRALALLDRILVIAPSPVGADLERSLSAEVDVERVRALAEAGIARLRHLKTLREGLRLKGVEDRGAQPSDRVIRSASERLADELVALWDDGFAAAASRAVVEAGGPSDLEAVFERLDETLAAIDACGEALGELMNERAWLKEAVVGPRISPLVEAAFAAMQGTRPEIEARIGELLDLLEGVGLRGVVAPEKVVEWGARALLGAAAEPIDALGLSPDRAGFEAQRAAEEASIVTTLVAIHGRARRAGAAGPDPMADLSRVFAAVPAELGSRVAEADAGRVERAVTLLERWWRDLSATYDGDDPQARLERFAASGFYAVTRDEDALLRMALEVTVLSEMFPQWPQRSAMLAERIRALRETSTQRVHALLQGRADRVWRDLEPES